MASGSTQHDPEDLADDGRERPMSFRDFLLDPFDFMAGWLQGNLLLPLLWHLGLSAWEDISYGWALVALYGVIAQVGITLALSMPAERFAPPGAMGSSRERRHRYILHVA